MLRICGVYFVFQLHIFDAFTTLLNLLTIVFRQQTDTGHYQNMQKFCVINNIKGENDVKGKIMM